MISLTLGKVQLEVPQTFPKLISLAFGKIQQVIQIQILTQ
jgi:hypothetical protein